MTLHCNNVC